MRANWRNAVAFLHDVAAAAAAWVLGYLFRFNFELYMPYEGAMVSNLAWVVPVQAGIFLWLRMYRGLWRYASLPDLRRILTAALLGAMAVAVGVVLLQRPNVPRSVLILYPLLLATIGVQDVIIEVEFHVRYRTFLKKQSSPSHEENKRHAKSWRHSPCIMPKPGVAIPFAVAEAIS